MMRAAAYFAVTVGLFLTLSLWVNGLLGALVAVVALGYGLGRLLKKTQGVRDSELPASRSPWNPW